MTGASSVQELAQEKRRGDEIRTSIVDGGGRFTLLSFAASSRLAGLLDSSRSSSRLARSFDRSGNSRFAGCGGISVDLSDLAELLQVLLDSAGSASDYVGSKLMRC